MHAIRYGLLCLLEQESDHGYRLWQRFEGGVGQVWELNVGQVYQTLPTLERRGYVKSTPHVVDEDAPRGPSPKPKRDFAITDKGSRALEGWGRRTASAIEPVRDRMLVLLLMLAEARPELALKHVDAKERTYRQYLVRLRKRQRKVMKTESDPMVPLLCLDFAVQRAKSYLVWLDRCRILLERRDYDAVLRDDDEG